MDRKEVYELAAAAQGCSLAEIMAAALLADGSLVVVVYPGPKYVFSPEVVARIAFRNEPIDTMALMVPGLPAAPAAVDTIETLVSPIVDPRDQVVTTTEVAPLVPEFDDITIANPTGGGTSPESQSGQQPKLIETPVQGDPIPKKTRQRKGK